MAELNIVLLKNDEETLRKKCRFVDKVTPHIIELLDNMKETLTKSGGVGLAAPQVGVLRRVAIVDDGEKQIELINPEIIESSGEQQAVEGCLSCPGQWGYTKRPAYVKVRATDRNGNQFEYATEEPLTVRCFCHEIDHLDGVIFIDNAVRMLEGEELEEYTKD